MTEIVRTKLYYEKDRFHARLRKAVEKPRKASLWGTAYTITPALCGTIYGDGRALITIETMHSRPWYYVIRGDSGWRMDMDADYDSDRHPNFRDFVDDVLSDLQEEFGDGTQPDWEDLDTWKTTIAELEAQKVPKRKWPAEPVAPPWPALNDSDGCAWGRMAWPKLRGVRFEPLPAIPYWKSGLLTVPA